jgi:pSer/pThr/pTyr-binding forkhead associated (FHA) protein
MGKPRLVVVRGAFPGTTYDLGTSDTLIGRNPGTDVTLVDEGVSRDHAVISCEDGSFAIEDLQSTNGTRVNGKRVRRKELCEGDEIQIGSTVLAFRQG